MLLQVRFLMLYLLVLPAVPAQAAEAPASPPAATVALIADHIIDGKSARPLPAQVVLVVGNHIQAIGGLDIIPAGAQRIELGNATLMPGLIDTHTHPMMNQEDYQTAHLQQSSAYKSLKALKAVQNLLGAGWTGLRIMGDADVFYGAVDLARVIREGVFPGPRIAVAAHYLSVTGGGGDNLYFSPEQHLLVDGRIADGPDEMRKAVREEIKYGSDWIKILMTGAFMAVNSNPRSVDFSPEELRAVVDEATRHNVPVAAHAHALEGIKQAVNAGVRSIEHGTYMDDEAIRMMKEHGTFLVPTIYIGDYYYDVNRELRAQERNDDYFKNYRRIFLQMVGRAHRAGVKIAVGVDLGGTQYDPTVSVRELKTLVEAGMTPMEALQAATRVGAELLRWDDRLGTLEPGKLADIIAVPGDPLQDLTTMEHVSFVMLDGKVIKQPNSQTASP
jgi:imidazolonepropionase-like amidohydrolase